MDYVLKIDHLKKNFGTNDVLKDVNLYLNKGENLVILGKSGIGKSVLIKCLIGLIEPDDGNMFILDKNIAELDDKQLNELRQKVGFLFQSAALYDSMTVRENLEFPLRTQKKLTREEIDRRVMEALQNVGLPEAIDKMPSELSGGMRKRIGLARTIILNPEIVLYDEPTTGLDPITSKEISTLILKIQQKYKTASIIITHDIQCARITGNRIIILNDGICVGEGTFNEMQNSDDPLVRSFFN